LAVKETLYAAQSQQQATSRDGGTFEHSFHMRKYKKKTMDCTLRSMQADEVDSFASLPFALEGLSMDTSLQGKSPWQCHVCTGKKWP
jgi:hypothetical protein